MSLDDGLDELNAVLPGLDLDDGQGSAVFVEAGLQGVLSEVDLLLLVADGGCGFGGGCGLNLHDCDTN